MRPYSPVNFADVTLTGSFWSERLETVLTKTIPSQHQKLNESGILGSLTITGPSKELPIPRNHIGFTTMVFWDSDVGKWIEAASFALNHRRDPVIEQQIDDITERLAEGQEADGYLNFWYLNQEPENRWTNLRDNHELYNAGHLIEGAVAYFYATGKTDLLDIMERYVDHIITLFGDEPGKRRGYPGHQEIELALVKFYHATGERKYLDLATYFINERGQQPHYFDIESIARGERPEDFNQGTHEYSQSHIPVRQQDKVVGHAVRAMYMYAAMADLAAELGDAELKQACELLWKDVTETRMYVTGGFGPSESNEGFTTDYDLPNDTSYCETCASVSMIYWAQRMGNLDLDGQYGDILELALYNNTLAGLSRDGTHYFYDNKLESDGSHHRWDWHPCPCCTMNVARLVASVASYFYSVSDDSIAVHLYGANEASVNVNGTAVTLSETSNYPWDGDIKLAVTPEVETDFTLKLRIPSWAKDVSASVNGQAVDVDAATKLGYVHIERVWRAGDSVELTLPMPPRRLYAHPEVKADLGRVALARGPLVYCFEQVDNPSGPIKFSILPETADITATVQEDLFDGIVTLSASGKVVQTQDWGRTLYRTQPPKTQPATLTAVPYYLWCNRGSNPMQVWLNT